MLAPATRLIVLSLLALWLSLSVASAEQYRLEPGDRIRAQVIGINAEPYVSMIDLSGDIRFPILGTHRAAGKTVAQLINDIALDLTGRQIRVVLDGVERTVIWGAFRPFPRGLLGREYALVPKPAWLPSHRRQAKVARALTRFQARPGPLKLLAILWHGLRP